MIWAPKLGDRSVHSAARLERVVMNDVVSGHACLYKQRITRIDGGINDRSHVFGCDWNMFLPIIDKRFPP